jgi:small-conductance mechanosensitive channel
MDFGPGYAHYVLRYWLINPLPDDLTDSDVRVHILATLQRNGIRLATDDHTIHLVEEGASIAPRWKAAKCSAACAPSTPSNCSPAWPTAKSNISPSA